MTIGHTPRSVLWAPEPECVVDSGMGLWDCALGSCGRLLKTFRKTSESVCRYYSLFTHVACRMELRTMNENTGQKIGHYK